MARTPQPDVDAIADDPTVLLERPAEDAFASVALPRPEPASAAPPRPPAERPTAANEPRPSSAPRAIEVAGAPAAPPAPGTQLAPVRPRRRLPLVAKAAIGVSVLVAGFAVWLITVLLRP